MLRLIAGSRAQLTEEQGLVLNVQNQFFLDMEDFWLEDDFIRRVIQDVDRVNIAPGKSTKQAILECGFTPMELSGGTMALMLIKYTDALISMTRMGPNCYKYLFEICRTLGARRLALTGYCNPKDSDIQSTPILFENTGTIVTTQSGFLDEYAKVVTLLD